MTAIHERPSYATQRRHRRTLTGSPRHTNSRKTVQTSFVKCWIINGFSCLPRGNGYDEKSLIWSTEFAVWNHFCKCLQDPTRAVVRRGLGGRWGGWQRTRVEETQDLRQLSFYRMSYRAAFWLDNVSSSIPELWVVRKSVKVTFTGLYFSHCNLSTTGRAWHFLCVLILWTLFSSILLSSPSSSPEFANTP